MRYAYFPAARRLAIRVGGQTRVYDTLNNNIGGFSQQQSGDQSLTFTSQFGLVRVADLPLVSPAGESAPAPAPRAGARATTGRLRAAARRRPTDSAKHDIFAAIERLADLRQKNILTEEEFAAKKAELLSRL